MAFKLPPLSGLRLFEAAARCGSFKRAAQELSLTPGALSHGIDSLEQWLDVELFERRTRGVVLTPAGRQYLPYISEALSTIAIGTLRLPSRHFENRLSISSSGVFAHKLLMPRINKFREMYPNMTVTVEASRQVIELPSDKFDVAIRSSSEAWPKLACDLIGRVSFVLVGAPGYISRVSHGGALDWPRVTLLDVSASGDWETWCNRTRTDTSAARKLVVNGAQLALEAAAGGLGLAIGRLPVLEQDIAAGRLAIAVDHVVPVTTGYWLVKPRGAEARREIVAFRNWLLEEMSQLRWNGHQNGYGEVKAAS
jgi:LysR family transcriptional regulator, glycine cleavage system transcriptional activator